ncbi:unnamed protein product [Aspergillus oryzae RIB40]|uniref:ATP-dependent DNA helicase n=1 Tax=Aspergillus oryzae (strain ATCC 42149 / RIB 40) TaxID=510516 RepID=Q2U5W6_ASPOR|nr:unnamed protein product [Aspergillus oryzae RIB40]BAE63049.1 unnamed protein product [Aspergillus oryzae RIB40]
MANASGSALGSLHSAVYFDENDFDDDLDLDSEESEPVIPPPKIVRPNNEQQIPFHGTNPTTLATHTNKPAQVSTPAMKNDDLEIKYPELPPIPDDDPVPSSSIPVPWSSSPPSHFQKPTSSRTLPWLKKEEPTPAVQYKKPETPVRSKSTAIWNKSASAIKEEQKELRRQYKSQKSESVQHRPRAKIAPLFLSDEQKHVLNAVVEQGKSIFFTGSAGTGKSVLMREIIKKLRDKYRREPDRVAVTASTGLAACNIEGVTLHSFAGIGNNGRPFGGIQLVVTGDFFQLPPVPDGSTREAKFAFSAATWNTSIQHTILLTTVFRQADPDFANMLNEMRLGKLSQRTIDTFQQLQRPLDFHDSLEATEL